MDFSETRRDDGIMLLRLKGRMDIEGTGEVDLRLTAATAEDGMRVIIDLTDVTFMASIGIGVLVRLAKAIRLRNGAVVLTNPQPIVKLVLDKTGIPEVIRTYGTIGEAAAALQA
jgi:anti-anti-sigma factor